MIRPILVSLLLAVTLTTSATVTSVAQEVSSSGISTDLSSDHAEVTVGDIVTLSLVVSHPVTLTVVIPRFEREWGPFEVKDQTTVQTVSETDRTRTIAKQVQVTLFAPGDFQTPDLPISVRYPDGRVEEIYPNPLRLAVNSVLSGSDDQLKDLRPPADLSWSFWRQPYAIALSVVVPLSLLAISGYFLYRRSRPRIKISQTPVETRTPREIAVHELQRIGRLDLPASSNIKEHYTLVSAALRAYLGATFLKAEDRLAVSEMSTEEIGAAIEKLSLEHGSIRSVLELLREADLVKFATYAPPVSRAYEATAQALSFVEETESSQVAVITAKGAHSLGGQE